MTTTQKWLYGLASTTVNGFASGVVLMIADPQAFNLQDWPKLLTVCAVLGALGMANYLKASPLPKWGDDDGSSTLRSITIFALIGITAFTVACGLKGSARHSAVIADSTVYSSLAALQDAESAMYTQCTAASVPAALARPCASVVKNHKDFNAKLVPALKTGQRLNRVIRNWPADKPAPAELPALAEEVRVLVQSVADNFEDSEMKSSLLSKAAAVSNAVIALLVSLK